MNAIYLALERLPIGLAGLLVAGQHLTGPQWLAIGCVTAAAVGAIATAPTRKPSARRCGQT